jgi:hypothetical protein
MPVRLSIGPATLGTGRSAAAVELSMADCWLATCQLGIAFGITGGRPAWAATRRRRTGRPAAPTGSTTAEVPGPPAGQGDTDLPRLDKGLGTPRGDDLLGVAAALLLATEATEGCHP